jgi:hypothetical protein
LVPGYFENFDDNKPMSSKTTVVLAIAAGLLGGIASQRAIPTVQAQVLPPVLQEIRAHKFVLVNEAGVDLGVFGIAADKGNEYGAIEMMDAKGSAS